MLKRWTNKKKLLLGQVVILDKREIKSKYAASGIFLKKDTSDAWIRQMVQSVVELKKLEGEDSESEKFVGVDIIFARHQFGDVASLQVEDLSLPILWRPQLHVVFRIFNIKCGSTIESFEYKKKMSWLRCFRRILSFRLIQPFDMQDIEPLFISSYIDFLKNAKKHGFV